MAVDLGRSECGKVESATVIEIELSGLVDDGLRMDRRSKTETTCGHSADRTTFEN